jgi:hypothetical protein
MKMTAPVCRCVVVSDLMPKADRDAFLEALQNENIPAPHLARVVTENGFYVTAWSIKRHRRRHRLEGCNCL